MKGFATLATTGGARDKGTCPLTLPSFFPELQKLHVGVGPAFTKHIRDPLESEECCAGVWPSLRAAPAGWVRQWPRGKQQVISHFPDPTQSFLLSLEGTAL